MEKDMASKKVIARSPWFGVDNRNLLFLAGCTPRKDRGIQRKTEPVYEAADSKAPHGCEGNWPLGGDHLQT
jgi:hypothetical protein